MTTTTTPSLRRGAITWREEESGHHTQSPDQAQAWRDHARTVVAITDPDHIAEVISRPGLVWIPS